MNSSPDLMLRRQIADLPLRMLYTTLAENNERFIGRYDIRHSLAAAKLGIMVGSVEFAMKKPLRLPLLGYNILSLSGLHMQASRSLKQLVTAPLSSDVTGAYSLQEKIYEVEKRRLSSPVRSIDISVSKNAKEPERMTVMVEPNLQPEAFYEKDARYAHEQIKPGTPYRFSRELLPAIDDIFNGEATYPLSNIDCYMLGEAIRITPAQIATNAYQD